MIRKAKLEDVEIVNSICRKYKALTSIDEDNDYISWLKEHVENNSLFFVYEINNIIVGFILCENLMNNGLMIWMCGVIEENLNKKVATKLFERVEQEYKNLNIKWVIAYGYTNNKYVDKLLKKFNFQTNNNIYKEYLKNIN